MTMRDAAISFPLLGEGFVFDPPADLNALLAELGMGPLPFNIHFYGAIIALGFVLAVWYGCRRAPEFGLTTDDIIDMLIFAVPLAIICARLYYCITYQENGVNPYFREPIRFLYIWKGGLAIYGGVIGAVIGVILSCRRKHIPIGPMLDVGGMGLLIGQAIGRWGNFMNREAFGWSEGVDQLFCRMGLTLPGQDTFYVHPTFLYESLWNALGILLLHIFTKKCARRYDGQIFTMYIGWYGLGRALIEGLRTDSLWLIPDVLRISQCVAVACVVIAAVLLWVNCREKREPGSLWVDRKAALAAVTIVGAGEAEIGDKSGPETEAAVEPQADAPPEDGAQTETEQDPAT